ncbi:RHOMBOID-like protein 3 [Zea mays]|uniref:RHOMBOID-like protein 3 n=1 Tax=Zea mays TaxID=4577 RepID=A0A1D6I967_MAIZE|nr:RHOMBOID-like protein 3 [Zea mays]ONM56580.1 RHOMBOID-like protein 3 [Zea mays]
MASDGDGKGRVATAPGAGYGYAAYGGYQGAEERKWWPWLVPTVIVACIAVFVVEMYENNCPKHGSQLGDCVAGFLRRFSFQPLRENPLLGPSSSTSRTPPIRVLRVCFRSNRAGEIDLFRVWDLAMEPWDYFDLCKRLCLPFGLCRTCAKIITLPGVTCLTLLALWRKWELLTGIKLSIKTKGGALLAASGSMLA